MMTGKSALARSIADTVAESGMSIASYFISRSIPQSRKAERVVQTLAYQLAQQDADICEALLATLTLDPGLLQQNIKGQVQQLLLAPLASAYSTMTSPTVIIIDGLDEAEDVQTLLFEVVEPVATALSSLPQRTKLILSSREFGALRTARMEGALQKATDVQWLHEIDEVTVRSDMRMFFTAGLRRIRQRANLDLTWPTNTQVNEITDRARSLFIYAATVLHFLGEEQYSPKTRLEQLLSSHRHLPAASGASGSALAELDALYMEILLSFVGNTPMSLESDLVRRLRLVLAAVIYAAEPMSMRILSGILSIHITDLEPIIRGLAAIWVVPQDRDDLVFIYHLSFSEFIGDATRCTAPRFCVTPAAAHEMLANGCVRKMAQTLRRDIFNLIKPGEPLPQIESYSLGIIEEVVEPTLRYACLHGIDTHLRQSFACGDPTTIPIPKLVDEFTKFCDEHLLHWVEVRVVLGEDSLKTLIRTLHHWTVFKPVCFKDNLICSFH